ncbi:MAG: tyrosine recombinase XerC [Clostridia bacterium]|nr:tyrosine recombinase XerC [Clostridia bacterium]
MHIKKNTETFPLLDDFTRYLATVGGRSPKTCDEYYLDLRLFFRYMKWFFGMVPQDKIDELDTIDIGDIDLSLITRIKLTDVYAYLDYLARDRAVHPNSTNSKRGLSATSRARKIASIRAFYKYLEKKARVIETNPMSDLETPKIRRSLPKYLSLKESVSLLEHIDGEFRERDYCIITFFLNCGLRVSELCGIDLTDIREDSLRVVGKGNKERVVFLNEACINALNTYLQIRKQLKEIRPIDRNALFISKHKKRISTETVKWLVKKYCSWAGLDPKISVHKLRHTSATLMYRNGVDVRVLQEILGHQNLNTTEIYTHVEEEDLRTAARVNPLATIKQDDKKS